MKKTITKSTISKIAKNLSPEILISSISEQDNLLILNLKFQKKLRTIEQGSIISMQHNKIPLEPSVYDFLLNKIKKEIKETILKFGKNESDFIIDQFKLHEIYKNQYIDKNIMYKVPYKFDRKINNRRITKSLSFFYFDEIKLSLPSLYYFWILLVKDKLMHEKINAIYDIIHSIIERYKQLIFTYDIIKNIIANIQHYGNPDSFFIFYYHFTFFVSLIKTIGDNMAWLFNLYFKLNIDYSNIDLQGKKFRNIIYSYNKNIANLIYSHEYFKEYIKLRDLRDIIQHRHIIIGMRVVVIDKRGKEIERENKILIPNDFESLIDNDLRIQRSNLQRSTIAEDQEAAIRYGLHEYHLVSKKQSETDYSEPLEYCQKHLIGVTNLLEKLINYIIIDLTKKPIGEVIHFYPNKSIAVLNLEDTLKLNDSILIEGNVTSFIQRITELEINLKKVKQCEKGKVGTKVINKVRKNDKIYLVKNIDNKTFFRYI